MLQKPLPEAHGRTFPCQLPVAVVAAAVVAPNASVVVIPAAEYALHQLRTHPPSCRCSVFPLTYDEFIELPPERQEKAVEGIARMLQQVQLSDFANMAKHFRQITDCIHGYVPLRAHPELFDRTAGWRAEW